MEYIGKNDISKALEKIKEFNLKDFQINDLFADLIGSSYKTVDNNKNIKLSDEENEWFNNYILKLKNTKSNELKEKRNKEKIGTFLKNTDN
ncbi:MULTISPECIES: hypothetical protein [unclassified Empedobacter]|uniref:hypothetical protein n=1 Tax=unclassified Empedobacter TaxID=2643773 RepID=UPI0025C50167|nr:MULTISPECIES: hypothetical protein [unclassified Empedobacter]